MDPPDEAVNEVVALHVRADYILEKGVWSATCRGCGWQTSDPIRRRAATRFRSHHKEVLLGEDELDVVIDIRDGAPGANPSVESTGENRTTPNPRLRTEAPSPGATPTR